MSFICPVVADASCPLVERALFVDNVISLVEDFFCDHFNISWEINAIITTSLPWLVIPEDGIGGKTYASDFVILAISQKSVTVVKASEMLVHELTHAVRWGKNSEWSRDLFCELVSEGLAIHVETEFAKMRSERTFFLETVLERSEDENRRLFQKLMPKFAMEKYDYDSIFFGGDEWPRWAGYSVGCYIVKKYLEKTGKDVFGAMGDLYEDFRIHVVDTE